MILNGCRLGFYEPLRSTSTRLLYSDSSIQSLGINIFSGATSGILGAAAGSPFFLVKTRLQSYSPFLPVGTQHGYKNAVDGLQQILRAEGVRGLYRGVGAACVRTGFGSSVQLPTYFFAKRRLVKHLGMKEGAALHLTSSAASGVVVCIFMHPPGTFSSHVFTFHPHIHSSTTILGFHHREWRLDHALALTTSPNPSPQTQKIASFPRYPPYTSR